MTIGRGEKVDLDLALHSDSSILIPTTTHSHSSPCIHLFPTLQIAISIADYAAISPRFALAGAAILTASLLGWLMPLVANIVPIQVGRTHWSRREMRVNHEHRLKA